MCYNSEQDLFNFLYDFLEFNEYEAILPDYFVSVYNYALNILLSKTLDYLKDKNVSKEEIEFFNITMALECLYRVLCDFPLNKQTYARLALLIDDTSNTVENNYPTLVSSTPSYSKFLYDCLDFLTDKKPPIN